jgi:malic enzyme-like protein
MASRRQEALDYHSQGRPGKIQVSPTKPFKNQRDLSLAYTPGVAEPCLEIQKNPDPGYYDGKTVVTAGSVASSTGVLGYATFQLKDSGGAITVVTVCSGSPRDNTRVEVKGKFHSAFTLGTKTLAVLEESRRRPIGPY